MSRPWHRVLAPVLLGTALGLAPAVAEDDEAIFADGAFDNAVAQGQASEDKSKLSWIGGVSLASTSTLVVPTDRQAYGTQSLFTGKGYLKATQPTVGSLFVSYAFTDTLWAGTNDPGLSTVYAKGAPNPASPTYVLSEAHVSFDVAKVVFLRVGTQLVDWGASAVWSPADFLNRKTDPTASVDTRTGLPGVRVHVPFNGGNLFVFGDASKSLVAGVPQDLASTGSVGFKVDKTVGGWNLGVIGNFGRSTDPRAGVTATGAVFGVDVWGEAGGVLPVGGHELSYGVSAGGEKVFGLDSEWTVRAEGFWNPQGHGDVAFTVPSQAYYWGQAYAYAEVVRQKLWGPDVTGSVSVTANLSDLSSTSTASLRTSFPGTVPLSFYAQYNGGAPAREFTLSTGGPAVVLGLRSVLEF